MPLARPRVTYFLVHLWILLAIVLTGCMGTPRDSIGPEVDMEEMTVTKRDIEVARQMQAPESVIESMEAGEWLYLSDRERVRYAELAIDHMNQAHNQACGAKWATTPWLLSDSVDVELVVSDGLYADKMVTVRVSVEDGHPCVDNWYATLHREDCEALVMDLLEGALSDVSRRSWAGRVYFDEWSLPADFDDDASAAEAVRQGSIEVSAFIESSSVPGEEQLKALRDQVIGAFAKEDCSVYVWLAVVPDVPDGAICTCEYGEQQVRNNAEIMTISGGYERG